MVIMSAPHKFDFEISCNEVKVCGRKQQKIMKIFSYIRIINMRSCREKEWITNKTADIIKKISQVRSWFI